MGSPGHSDTVIIHSDGSFELTPVNTKEFHCPSNANIILAELLTTPLFSEEQNCTYTL